MPDIIDEDGDDTNVIFDYKLYPWLRYDKATNSFRVKEKTTTDDLVGKYKIYI